MDRTEVAHLQAEIGFGDSAFSINLLPPDLAPDDEAPLLDAAVRSLERRARLRPQLAVLVGHPARTAALDAYLPRLRATNGLVATIFLSPRFDPGPVPDAVPPGYDSLVVLDPERARRRLWPALDCRRSRAMLYSSERHRLLAERARVAIAAGGHVAERLHAYLTQPMKVAELFMAQRAETVPLPSLLDDVERLIDGTYGAAPIEDLDVPRLPRPLKPVSEQWNMTQYRTFSAESISRDLARQMPRAGPRTFVVRLGESELKAGVMGPHQLQGEVIHLGQRAANLRLAAQAVHTNVPPDHPEEVL